MSGKTVVKVLGSMLVIAMATAWQAALAHCPEDGTGNFIEIGGVVDDVTGSAESFNQYGNYPADWFASIKFHAGDYFDSERFELRMDDVSTTDGRCFTRLTIWPLTIEKDCVVIGGYAWDASGSAPQFQEQSFTQADFKLRFHRGEFDNMMLRFEQGEYDRTSSGSLQDFEYQRLSGKYNFTLCDGAVRGQFRQVSTSIDAPRIGRDVAEIDSTQLKLNAGLSDSWDAYGKATYNLFNYVDLPDGEMTSMDYTVGLRYRPDCLWEMDASYRYKENPDDNTVTSHVTDYDSYGVNVSYVPGCGNVYEAGYRHSSLSYAQLDMQDATTRALLRGSSVVTPAQVAGAVTTVSPERDQYWVRLRHQLTDDLLFTGRLEYNDGDAPRTHLVAADNVSLFFDEQLVRTTSLFYDATPFDQFGLTFHGQESSANTIGSDLDLHYLEGSWTRCLSDGWLTLAYRDTAFDLDTPGINRTYVTDDKSYLASYSKNLCDFDYALNYSYTDGEGAEEFTQTGAGANIKFKNLGFGPLILNLDWFDRDYAGMPSFDCEAMEVGLTYHLEF